MFDISLLCPTRNRPDGLETMWMSAIEMADNPESIELVLYIDDDDKNSISKSNDLRERFGDQINATVGKRGEEIYSNLHNICCSKSRADIFFGCADDLIFRTTGWDSRARHHFEKIADKIAYIFPDDGHWGEELGTHGFFHRKWYEALGYLSPPVFTVDYSDNYVADISRAVGRYIYMPEVLVEHMHWTFGKSAFDKTAQEAHVRRHLTDNAALYRSSETENIKKIDIKKLQDFMNV